MSWLDVTRAAVGALLIAAGVAKLATHTSVVPFLETLSALPRGLTASIARILPWVEVAGGLLAALGRRPWSMYPAAALAVGFVLLLGWARLSGVTANCHCFGALDRLLGGPWPCCGRP